MCSSLFFLFFFFNDTPPTEIYTLSLHDALPIFGGWRHRLPDPRARARTFRPSARRPGASSFRARARSVPADRRDRKSTRLNSSHTVISYAVFCLKKKKKKKENSTIKTTRELLR